MNVMKDKYLMLKDLDLENLICIGVLVLFMTLKIKFPSRNELTNLNKHICSMVSPCTV